MSNIKQTNTVEVKKYKVTGLSYSKPHKTIDGKGEVVFYQNWIDIYVGVIMNYNGIPKKVVNIEWDSNNRCFKVYFFKGGLKIIPYTPDMEIYYDQIEDKILN